MAKRIRITESELTKLIQRVIKENEDKTSRLDELEQEMMEMVGQGEINEGWWKNFWDKFRWLNRKKPRGFPAGGPF